MDWQFIERHLISGLIPVFVALVLYFAVLNVLGKKQRIGHILLSFVFCIYLLGILTTTGLCVKGTFSPRIDFIPFADMIRSPIYTILNILLFMPLGFFLPLLYKEYDQNSRIALIGFLVSLSVEIVQLFGMGTTDINDLITNTVGTCFGYCIYKFLYKAISKSWVKQIRVIGSQCFYELPILWIGSLIIMLTIQPTVFHALYPVSMYGGEIQAWK